MKTGHSRGRILAAVVTSTLFATLAPALPQSVAAPPEGAVKGRLAIGGIDEAQAVKVGNKVTTEGGERVLRDGKTGEILAKVPASTPNVGPGTRSVAPRGSTMGDCGFSYLYMRDHPDPGKYEFLTGVVSTKGPMYDFHWEVHFSASYPGGNYKFEWDDSGPIFPNVEWNSQWKTDQPYVPNGTRIIGEVRAGVVFLINGTVCYPIGPTESTVVN